MKNNLKKYMLASVCFIALMSCEKEEVTTTSEENNQTISTKNSTSSSVSMGGSLAQFTIVDEYLYTIDFKSVKIFDLSNGENPTLIKSVDLGIGIETIHAQNDHLFVGTNTGVRILSIENPTEIVEVSEFEHITSCDPVIANNNYALSTLRGGTECGGTNNELNIIDISNINDPQLKTSVELTNPYGLSFSNSNPNLVYVCDGYNGLKAYDFSNLEDIKLVMEIDLADVKDIIVTDDNLMVVLTANGIYQYDASNPVKLIEKSFISIK